MIYKPDIVCIDFETALTDGTPSIEHYRHDFRIVSCAYSWYDADGNIKNHVHTHENSMKDFLTLCNQRNTTILVFNAQFEIGVALSRLNIELDSVIDVMRLAQVRDNGGSKGQEQQDFHNSLEIEEAIIDGKFKSHSGMGLTSCCKRLLPGYENHKKYYHELIVERGGEKGKEGSALNLLSTSELHAYNVADSDNTLKLYTQLLEDFKKDNYCYKLDHSLYLGSVWRIIRAKIRGVKVDRERLKRHCEALKIEIDEIYSNFYEAYREQIDEVTQDLMNAIILSKKTQACRDRWIAKFEEEPKQFNLNSTKQLSMLFNDKMGMEAKFRTDKGNPRFGAAFLGSYGDAGNRLKGRKTLILCLKQSESLLALSEYDGRWHISLKACGTATGRFSGGYNFGD